MASWLDARAHGGRWLLRLDDLDTPRVAPGAEQAILDALTAHGLLWDGPVYRQSDLAERHAAALGALQGRIFACACTRRALRGSKRYPGTCRNLRLTHHGNALRFRVDDCAGQSITDRVQGRCREAPDTAGDFVVWRRDGIASYPLTVVVDDAAMGVTDIVRGADLLDTTPNQLRLMAHLGTTPPRYAHIPVIAEASGVKLSKHNAATAIDTRFARQNIASALCLLGLPPPTGDIGEMLAWAQARWRCERLPALPVMPGFVALA